MALSINGVKTMLNFGFPRPRKLAAEKCRAFGFDRTEQVGAVAPAFIVKKVAGASRFGGMFGSPYTPRRDYAGILEKLRQYKEARN
jgi:hypothetical protein